MPPSVSALFARGTRPSRDSLICTPVSVLWRSFWLAIERFLIVEPSMRERRVGAPSERDEDGEGGHHVGVGQALAEAVEHVGPLRWFG